MRKPVEDQSTPKHGSKLATIVSNSLTSPLGYLAALTLFALLLVTLVNVFRRETTGRGIDATIEYTEVLMVVAVFAALAIAQRNGTHISTSFITSLLPRRAATTLNRVAGIFGAIVICFIILSAYDALAYSLARGEYTMGIARVELWPGRLVLLIGMVVYLYEYLLVIVRGPSMKSVAEEAETEFKSEEARLSDV